MADGPPPLDFEEETEKTLESKEEEFQDPSIDFLAKDPPATEAIPQPQKQNEGERHFKFVIKKMGVSRNHLFPSI